MGIDFRTGHYTRYVRLGKRTIKAGEAAAIWNINGVHREVVGPKLVHLWYSQIRFLDYFAASKDQYLVVSYLDGREEHIEGPFGMYKNPVFHKSIAVKKSYQLRSANEALVVYSSAPSRKTEGECSYGGGDIEINSKPTSTRAVNLTKRVIRGPANFTPTPNDKLYAFASGLEGSATTAVLSQMQNVDNLTFTVATIDEQKSSITLDVKVSINDMERFVDVTPYATSTLRAIVSKALSTDVVIITSDLKWNEVNPTLRSIETDTRSSWKTLKASLAECGCELLNCSYLTFKPSAELQKNHNEKIQQLNSLEQQKIADSNKLELKKKQLAVDTQKEEVALLQAKKKHQQELEKEEAILKHNSSKIEAEQELKSKQVAFETKLIREQEALKAELNERKNGEVISFLKEIKALEVDLTKLLVGGGSDTGKGNDKSQGGPGFSLVCKMVEDAPAFQAMWKKEDTEDADFEVVNNQNRV